MTSNRSAEPPEPQEDALTRLAEPYGGHPEFGPRVMANQAQPSLAGWEALAKDALLAWEECRAARSDAEPPTTEREALLRDRIWQSGYSAGRAAAMRAATEPADGLDEAWAEAEAALPKGPWMLEVGRYGAINGAVNPHTGGIVNQRPERYFASAGHTWSGDELAEATGPTPAAALHALAAALRSEPVGSAPEETT